MQNRCNMCIRALGPALAVLFLMSCSPAASSDHPAIGHWQGTITIGEENVHNGAILVDTASRPLRVSLMFFNAGVNYTDCSDVVETESTLGFRLSRGKYDLQFDLSLAADGNSMSGTITPLGGNRSHIKDGIIQFVRIPRASDLPSSMRFSKLIQDPSNDYTLTITLAQTIDGQWTGIVDIPERSMDELTLFDVTETDGEITGTIRIIGPAIVFTMRISDDQQNLTGSWDQTDIDLPRVN